MKKFLLICLFASLRLNGMDTEVQNDSEEPWFVELKENISESNDVTETFSIAFEKYKKENKMVEEKTNLIDFLFLVTAKKIEHIKSSSSTHEKS